MILPAVSAKEDRSTGNPGLEVVLMVLAGMAATQVHRLGALGALALLGPALIWRHRRDPATVAGIVITLFCVSPFLRRLADYRFGYTPSSLVLASPYAGVAMVALLTLRAAPTWRRGHSLPVLFSFAAIAYAFCLGVLKSGIFPATIGLLQYSCGPLLLLLIAARPERFHMGRMEAWLGGIGAVTAAYGLYQYAVFPPWENLWLVSTGLAGPAGQPVPFGIRTWSTLNSMAPFSYFMAFILVVLIRNRWFLVVGPLCSLALVSTMARSAWATTALGWAFALVLLPGKDRRRLMTILGALVLILGLSTLVLPAESLDRLVDRVETLRNLEGDNSYNSRMMQAQSAKHLGILDPWGAGFGSIGTAARVGESGGMANFDNGFLALALTFGWVGSFLYFSGFLGSLLVLLFRKRDLPPTALLLLSAAAAMFVSNVFENSMSDFRGIIVWISVGAVIAVLQPGTDGLAREEDRRAA